MWCSLARSGLLDDIEMADVVGTFIGVCAMAGGRRFHRTRYTIGR